jgi:hypothetical protein
MKELEQGDIVVLRGPDGQGTVAEITGVETVRRKFSTGRLREPKIINGKLYPFGVREYNKILETNQIRPIREAFAMDEESARRVYACWTAEYEKEEAALSARPKEKPNDPLEIKPPSQCEPFSKFDVEDHQKAREALLRETFPNIFAAYETKDKAAIRRAYVLDIVALTGKPPIEVTPDENFTRQLYRVYDNKVRAKGKAEETAAIKSELLRGWFLGYAFLSHEDRAKEVNRALHSKYPTEKIRSVLRALGLVPKRQSGPSWKKA